MINQLKILHRTAKEDLTPIDLPHTEWKTCLRSISFHSGNLPSSFEGEEAYEFLLQVICGMKSPMLGETEILAQFKGFLKKNPSVISKKISDRLIQDSKKIRTKYLKNYGSQSYGSFTLKESKSYETIVMLGAGALSQDIIPIVKDFSGEITVTARNLEKAQKSFKNYPKIKISSFEKLAHYKNALVVIAAPLSSEKLEKIIYSNFKESSVLDMRSTRDGASLNLSENYKYKTLEEIFSEIEETQQKLRQVSQKIEIEIKELSKVWNEKAQIRPFGWEDLCY